MSVNADTEAKIIDAIYRGACDTSEFSRALELMGCYFSSPAVALGQVDLLSPEAQLGVASGFMDEQEMVVYRQYAHLDPMPLAFSGLPAGTVATSNRIVPDSVRRGVFVNEYLVPRGAKEAMGCSLFSSNGRFALISVLQGINQESHGDEDMACLGRIAPHLIRALQLRRVFLQGDARSKMLESIVDRNDTGMIGVRGDAPALFVNRAARAIGAARDGIALNPHGRLVPADRSAATQLAALQADVANGGAGGVVHVPRPSRRSPYLVLVSALPSGDDLFPSVRSGVLFSIHDPARRKVPAEQRIAELLHIPLGAAKVVRAMLAGEDLKHYAERTRISMNTVRFHLKNAFAGTETHSQAELMRVALSALNAMEEFG
jgi:hypothetical protein